MRLIFVQGGSQLRTTSWVALLIASLLWVTLWRVPSVTSFLLGRPPSCLLKVATGVPCLACRGTRAAFALGEGDLRRALAFNPAGTIFLLIGGGLVVLNAVTGLRPDFRMNRPERRLAWCLLIAALLGNWIYVIRAGG